MMLGIDVSLWLFKGDDASTWKQKHPNTWTIDDVNVWGNSIADANNLSPSLRRTLLVSLRRFSGKQLLRMTYDDVRIMFPDVADILYSAMQQTFSAYGEYQGKPFIINTDNDTETFIFQRK